MSGSGRHEHAAAGMNRWCRWIAWHAKFAWQAVLQRDFEDERVQRLVRQHFEEFSRGR